MKLAMTFRQYVCTYFSHIQVILLTQGLELKLQSPLPKHRSYTLSLAETPRETLRKFT